MSGARFDGRAPLVRAFIFLIIILMVNFVFLMILMSSRSVLILISKAIMRRPRGMQLVLPLRICGSGGRLLTNRLGQFFLIVRLIRLGVSRTWRVNMKIVPVPRSVNRKFSQSGQFRTVRKLRSIRSQR